MSVRALDLLAHRSQPTEKDPPASDKKRVIIFTEAFTSFTAFFRPEMKQFLLPCMTNSTNTVIDHIREGVVTLVVIDITSIASDEIRRIEEVVWDEAPRV